MQVWLWFGPQKGGQAKTWPALLLATAMVIQLITPECIFAIQLAYRIYFCVYNIVTTALDNLPQVRKCLLPFGGRLSVYIVYLLVPQPAFCHLLGWEK